jgi:carbamoyl-phosphate synthase large subunit
MGIDSDFGKAFAKAEMAAGVILATSGTVFVSMSDRDKTARWFPWLRNLQSLGFRCRRHFGNS